ncbi:ATP-binding protein [Streptomyces sp. NPDC013157]|uniref:ATP-binding protein n=1 Tax=Streptomyces sp. NPDC013157 TaxID=3364861 RepID=UPI00369547CD
MDGDAHQLAQVVGNLLSHACTHTPPDSRIRVRVGATRCGPRTGGIDVPGRTSSGPVLLPGLEVCVIEVIDDGTGLGPEDARHVFGRFYRADPPATAEAEPGSGLGLAIASAIATAHGGRLDVPACATPA